MSMVANDHENHQNEVSMMMRQQQSQNNDHRKLRVPRHTKTRIWIAFAGVVVFSIQRMIGVDQRRYIYNDNVNEYDSYSSLPQKLSMADAIMPSFETNESSIGLKINTNEIKTTTLNKKKFFALHIGPSKTGTSTIQGKSAEEYFFKTLLFKDNVAFLGKFQGGAYDKTLNWTNDWRTEYFEKFETAMACTTNISYVSSVEINDVSPKMKTEIKNCWKENNTTLSYFLSDEQYSYRFARPTLPITILILKRIFIDTFDYDEIVIIGSYRRYFDWVASTYNEQTRQNCLYQHGRLCKDVLKFTKETMRLKRGAWRARFYMNLDETILPLIDVNSEDRKLAENLLPLAQPTNFETASIIRTNKNISSVKDNEEVTHDFIASSSPIKFDILNFFQHKGDKQYYRSIITELYCKSLGMDRTPNACRLSTSKDSDGKVITSSKKSEDENDNSGVVGEAHHVGRPDEVPYHTIFVNAIRKGWIDPATQVKFDRNDTKHFRRIVMVQELEQYHTKTLGLNWKNNLPLICANRTVLDKLLRKSLNLESLIFPGFAKNQKLGRREHVRSFWELTMKKKAYCHVDTNILFENASSWNDIVERRMVIENW